MEKKDLDIKAVISSLEITGREAILGTFGDVDGDLMLNKMHNMIEMADKLAIKDLTITVSLKDLRKAKILYEKEEKVDEDD